MELAAEACSSAGSSRGGACASAAAAQRQLDRRRRTLSSERVGAQLAASRGTEALALAEAKSVIVQGSVRASGAARALHR